VGARRPGPGSAARSAARPPGPAPHRRRHRPAHRRRPPARAPARAGRGARRAPRGRRLAPRHRPVAGRRRAAGGAARRRAAARAAAGRGAGDSRRSLPGRIRRMTTKNSGPRGPRAAWMAWNRPGGSAGKSSGGGFGSLLDRLPDFGGGGGPLRWVGLALALWLAFNCFVLVAEQERGVVLRFGQVARVMEPGPHLKLPWPLERVIKVNATQIKNYEDRVPVLTRDENIVEVAVNVQYKVADPKLYLFGTRNGDEVLKQAALSTVREQVGRSD